MHQNKAFYKKVLFIYFEAVHFAFLERLNFEILFEIDYH